MKGLRASLPACVLAAATVIASFAWPMPERAQAGNRPPLLAITSAKNGLRDLSLTKLRRCFLRDTVFAGEHKLVPFAHPPGSSTRRRFEQAVLSMDEVTAQRYWIDSMIRGGPRAPRVVPDRRLLVRVVAQLPGAISYLEADPSQLNPGVTVLAIDGKHPGEADYPLN